MANLYLHANDMEFTFTLHDVQGVAVVLLHEILRDCATKVWKKDRRNGLKQSPKSI